jgi:hypothetical protein
MDAPLPTSGPVAASTPVQQHHEGDYDYELFPDLTCLVKKNGQAAYTVDTIGCECIGFRNRGTCKHWKQREQMVDAVLSRAWNR